MFPALCFFLKIDLAIWGGLLWFHRNFRVVFPISVEIVIVIVIDYFDFPHFLLSLLALSLTPYNLFFTWDQSYSIDI